MPGRFANLEFGDEERRGQEQDVPASLQSGSPQALPDAQQYLSQARSAYHWGEFEQALRLYTRSLQSDRKLIPAWVGQVQMLVELDECHEARVWSDKALGLLRSNGELLAAKAQACIRLNDRRSAFECSDAAMAAPGCSPWRWQVRGELLLAAERKQPDECFQNALHEPGADWFDCVIIARIYLFHGRVTSALHYLKKALAAEPTHGYTWFEAGNCERRLGLIEAAGDSFQHCLDLRGDYKPAAKALDELTSVSAFQWLRGVLRRWSRK